VLLTIGGIKVNPGPQIDLKTFDYILEHAKRLGETSKNITSLLEEQRTEISEIKQ
jgi:hypothetical protein